MNLYNLLDNAETRFTHKAQKQDNKLKRTSLNYELSLYSGILAILIIICLLIFKNI